jgi:hypothetical protein
MRRYLQGGMHIGHIECAYAGNKFEITLLETVHHHAVFMARTNEAPG